MPIIKCKMCGGDIQLAEGKTFGTCEYCGSTMTFPKMADEQRAAAFNRGNAFRRAGEFDKALAVYERIVADDDTDAEAHWCCALCRFGIEWVEDLNTFEYVPTCHRASFDSFLEDVDYKAALEYSDGVTRRQYQKDAAKIAEVQRGILSTSQNAEPYDVFISYKELDANGERTRDSILAQDIYYQLTEKGWRVFFSRISLEDVPGTQYEPYIFAALNSAKVMVVVGTSAANLNAVWVKNEWSRYLSLMRKDRTKLLLPCYRDMDPYDLPEQLSVLMSYDMGKIGFIQDLIRGVDKVLKKDEPKAAVKEPVIIQQSAGPNIDNLTRRIFIFLEDRDWKSAAEYCERVLDQDLENALAYLGNLMVELKVSRREALSEKEEPFDDRNNYKRAIRYGDDSLRDELEGYNAAIRARIEEKQNAKLYDSARLAVENARSESDWRAAARFFEALSGFRDAEQQAIICLEKADEAHRVEEMARKNAAYDKASSAMNTASNGTDYLDAAKLFDMLVTFRDAEEKAAQCRDRAKEFAKKAKEERIQKKRAEEEKREKQYLDACEKYSAANTWQDYRETVKLFIRLGEYKDSKEKIELCQSAIWELSEKERELNRTRLAPLRERTSRLSRMISAGVIHSLALDEQGNVYAVGDNYTGRCNVSGWKNMIAVYAGRDISLGLSRLGTVLTTTVICANSVKYGEEKLAGYGEMIQLATANYHSLGLRFDGTVCSTVFKHADHAFHQDYVSAWTDIISIDANEFHSLGLRSDGTVVAAGSNSTGRCNVEKWTDIVGIAAEANRSFELRADGTVLTTFYTGSTEYNYGEEAVSSWNNIIGISAGRVHVVGLTDNGTVVAAGSNICGQCDVSGWRNIVAISAGDLHTLGLRADGTVLAAGCRNNNQCSVSSWKLFDNVESLEARRIEAIESLNKEKANLQNELTKLSGLFAASKRTKLELRLAAIERDLRMK